MGQRQHRALAGPCIVRRRSIEFDVGGMAVAGTRRAQRLRIVACAGRMAAMRVQMFGDMSLVHAAARERTERRTSRRQQVDGKQQKGYVSSATHFSCGRSRLSAGHRPAAKLHKISRNSNFRTENPNIRPPDRHAICNASRRRPAKNEVSKRCRSCGFFVARPALCAPAPSRQLERIPIRCA